jgi:CRP/FNR family transcriptional regulator, dissimilatory nitrate respiration regulator
MTGARMRPDTESFLATTEGRAAFLAALPAFTALSSQPLQALARASQVVHVASGEPVVRRGERASCFWIVARGQVASTMSIENGRHKVLPAAGEGSVIGLAESISRCPSQIECRAVVDTTLLAVPEQALSAAIARSGAFGAGVLRELSDKMNDLICDLSAGSAESRVAMLLVQCSEGAEDPRQFRLPDRKRLLAARMGMTPETLSRVLRSWKDNGLLQTEGDHVRVLDLHRLRLAAYASRTLAGSVGDVEVGAVV